MQISAHRLVPVVVRARSYEHRYPWPHFVGALPSVDESAELKEPRADEDPAHPFRRGEFDRQILLVNPVGPLEIGAVVAELCSYNGVEPRPSSSETLSELLQQETLVVGGGLLLQRGSQTIIEPRCCCGLEQWIEWRAFARGARPPWCGHDEPFIERQCGGKLLFAANAAEVSQENSVKLEPRELAALLDGVENTLRQFSDQLFEWCRQVSREHAQGLRDRFVTQFVRGEAG